MGIFAIASGAIPGAVSRYYLTRYCKRVLGNGFPYGTFIINLTGCLMTGFLFTLFREIPSFPPEIELLLRIGFLGSYTTFSTYAYDTLTLWRNHKRVATLAYWLLSPILGVLAIVIGRYFAKLILS
ncbi:MAG: putative fluoride ion transporter CrcB [Chroococcopsis gigantea SAG 12.99]|nr:fluoride efflux transporter CrcB [Chlorogloea purpurea SAG 13.99]MDV3000362.1 putative fluoride ion transporter CrcB [Chroococcopsis gigantea SAG 12.99]